MCLITGTWIYIDKMKLWKENATIPKEKQQKNAFLCSMAHKQHIYSFFFMMQLVVIELTCFSTGYGTCSCTLTSYGTGWSTWTGTGFSTGTWTGTWICWSIPNRSNMNMRMTIFIWCKLSTIRTYLLYNVVYCYGIFERLRISEKDELHQNLKGVKFLKREILTWDWFVVWNCKLNKRSAN